MSNSSLSEKLMKKLAEAPDPRDDKFQGQQLGSQLYLQRIPPAPPPIEKGKLQDDIAAARRHDTWAVLVFVRMVNAITICTFFQPDEYYQALEPAWDLAFGKDSGAWITWEWQYQLRSSLHPILLGTVYKAIGLFSDLLFPPVLKTKYLVLFPKFAQAMQAVVMDYYTWALAERLYGPASTEATVVFRFLLLSPWQWFVSTRSFSNSLETALTAMALYYWPWDWMKTTATPAARKQDAKNLKWTILLAGFASILRPTNALIWAVLAICTLPYAGQTEFLGFVQDASIYGTAALGTSQVLDRWYYNTWTTPAFNWLHFNYSESIASFYGLNRPTYYLTEALPWLMMLSTPFALLGLYQALTLRLRPASSFSTPHAPALRTLALAALALPAVLSLIPHKEVRFIYPIFPILTLLAAPPTAAFYHPFPHPSSLAKKFLLYTTLAFNLLACLTLGYLHNRGLKSVFSFLRSEFEMRNPGMSDYGEIVGLNRTSLGVLMPCHSVPWRSHLVYKEVDAWALTCEPPVGMGVEEKAKYVDEADAFYDDPATWLGKHVGRGKAREWPDYLMFFGQLEGTLKGRRTKQDGTVVQAGAPVPAGMYEECWRGFNSFWHDDPRRRGDVLVWCKQQSEAG